MRESFAEALAPMARRLPGVAQNVEILRIVAHLDGDDFAKSVEVARSAVLHWAKNRAGAALPKEAWEHQDFDVLVGGRNSTAVRLANENFDLWALRAEDPDKNVARRNWTTEVVIGGQLGQRPQISLRLIVSTDEPQLRIEPHVPGPILQIIARTGLVRGGRILTDTPRELRTQNDAEDLCDHLEDPDRRLPLIVVARSDEDPHRPLINDAGVAKAVAGLARVVRVQPEFTRTITRRFGKHRSVFAGGVRLYMPGFSIADDPYRHRLFIGANLADQDYSNACTSWLRRAVAAHSVSSTRLGKDVPEFAALRTESRRLRASNLAIQEAPDAELLEVAEQTISSLTEELKDKTNEIDGYVAMVGSAEERASAAEQENRSLLYKLRQLVASVANPEAPPTDEPPLPQEWSEFADWLDQTFPDKIVLTPSARRMIRSPEFEDVGLVARAITWLATEQYHRRIQGGGSTRDEPIEPGVRNAYCGGDTYEADWQGRRYKVDQHIKNGGNTHDPKRCLRIYYFWEPDLQQVIIDHLPAHIKTGAT